jgi:signal transduction histidine kinase
MITSPWRIEDLLMESRGLLLRSNPEYKILIRYVGEPIHEEQLFIEGNKSLLKSAFMNIMDNCCKYSYDQTVEINLVFEEDGRRIIEMSDRGPGMNEEDIPLIFKPFYRDPKTQHKQGSGIGLTLVDSVMRLHQIDIEVLSERDKGTTFRLKLPPSEVK